MSEREDEVDGLVKEIKRAFEGDRRVYPEAHESLSRLAELSRGIVPSAYTPREEVTEGWWSALRFEMGGERGFIRVFGDRKAECNGMRYTLGDFTAFLPVPEYLVRGI